jgi:miniconductance mechanosensitive channel
MDELQTYFELYPYLGLIGILLLSVVIFFAARLIIGRGLTYLAVRTKTKYDDILVKNLHPYRVAWLAPLILIYLFASLIPAYQSIIEKFALFLIMWVSSLTIVALLNAVNEIYEKSPYFTGVSIQGYLDVVKLLVFVVTVIISISLFTGESPLVLLSGLGALTAILLLIFHDTILSFVASIQIGTQDLVKEGDWIEVPSYGADGDVVNMTLHTIKVQNFDKTITVIPTHKMIEVAYKNWRGMQESGGRRIMRSLFIDMNSIKFCDAALLERLSKIDLISNYVESRMNDIAQYQMVSAEQLDSPLDGPQITNIEVYRKYIEAYLRSRDDIHQVGMDLLIRSLAPSPDGLPIEVYVFAKTTVWKEYENIQAEIFDHLLAAVPNFDLRVFQQPTGLDFSQMVKALS